MMVKSWSLLAVAGIIFVLLVPALIFCVISLVRGNRADALALAPLVSRQEVNIPTAGEFVVLLEMPHLASGFGNIQVQVTEKQSGRSELMKYSYGRSQGTVRGFERVRMPLGRFHGQAGAYALQITGLEAGKDYSDYRLIFSRPYVGRMALQIVGIVVCGVGMLGCLIWAAWLAGLMKQQG